MIHNFTLTNLTETTLKELIVESCNLGIHLDTEIQTLDHFYMTWLQCAAHIGSNTLIKWLLNNGATINTPNKHGITALHWAVRNNHHDTILTLMNNGADVSIATASGTTILHEACRNGLIDIIKILLQSKQHINLKNKNGKTPLDMAVEHGHTDIVALLIKEGADIIDNGYSALYAASNKGWLDITELLLQHDAHAKIIDHDFITLLNDTAIQHNAIKTLQLLLRYKPTISLCDTRLLDTAIAHSGIPIIKLLLKKNVSLEFCYDNLTPLQKAVLYGRVNIAQLLINAGPKMDSLAHDVYFNCPFGDANNLTLIHLAVLSGKKKMVELIVKDCIDLLYQTTDEMSSHITPLEIAAHFNHIDIVKLLLEHSNNETIPEHYVTYAYEQALTGEEDFCSRGNKGTHYKNTLKLLIEHGAEVENIC